MSGRIRLDHGRGVAGRDAQSRCGPTRPSFCWARTLVLPADSAAASR